MRSYRLRLFAVIAFIIVGIALAWTHGFEYWVGRALEKAALAYMQEHHSREANFAAMDEAIQSMEIDPSRN